MPDMTAWLKNHLGTVVVSTTGVMFGLCAVVLGASFGAAPEVDPEIYAPQIAELTADRDAAVVELEKGHHDLVSQMDNVDYDRVASDGVLLRELLATMDEELGLDVALTAPQPGATGYRIADWESSLSMIRSLDYTYTSVVELAPADTESPESSKYFLVTSQTDENGTLSNVRLYEVSEQTTENLVANKTETAESGL